MKKPINISIAVEDDLSEAVLRRLLEYKDKFNVDICERKKGWPFLRENLAAFNAAASVGKPYCVLTDLDKFKCPPDLIKAWFLFRKNKNMIFRIAIKEVESWLMASRITFSRFMVINSLEVPRRVEEIKFPKEKLIELAKKSKSGWIRDSIIPKRGSTARIGPNYNSVLSEYVFNHWNLNEARKNSKSLNRAMMAFDSFRV